MFLSFILVLTKLTFCVRVLEKVGNRWYRPWVVKGILQHLPVALFLPSASVASASHLPCVAPLASTADTPWRHGRTVYGKKERQKLLNYKSCTNRSLTLVSPLSLFGFHHEISPEISTVDFTIGFHHEFQQWNSHLDFIVVFYQWILPWDFIMRFQQCILPFAFTIGFHHWISSVNFTSGFYKLLDFIAGAHYREGTFDFPISFLPLDFYHCICTIGFYHWISTLDFTKDVSSGQWLLTAVLLEATIHWWFRRYGLMVMIALHK